MKFRYALPAVLCLALPVSAANTQEPDDQETAETQEIAEFPPDLWGVYARKRSACRVKHFMVEGKIGIRANRVIVEGQPFEIGEVLQESDRMMIAEFVAPGGWSTNGVRMSFQLLRKNKLWHSTYAGKPAPKIGYVRCPRSRT